MQIRSIFLAAALLSTTPVWAAPEPTPTATPAAAAWSPASARQQREVTTVDLDWHDERRNRDVPVRIWYPQNMEGALPVVVFSHGLGGTRKGYGYLGRFLAQNGFIVILPQHIHSDDSVWRDKSNPMQSMKAAARDISEILARPEDISYVIDQAEKLNAEDPTFKGHLDLTRIAVGGHSFGAYTSLAASGRLLISPRDGNVVDLGDRRVKACIALSPPSGTRETAAASYAGIKVPCLHMTGTLDSSPIGGDKPEDRRIPYDSITVPDQYLITLNGGDHMVFSGRRAEGQAQPNSLRAKIAKRMREQDGSGQNGDPAKDPTFQRLIENAILGFLRAHLDGSDAAKEWLKDGGLAEELGSDATLEQKLTSASGLSAREEPLTSEGQQHHSNRGDEDAPDGAVDGLLEE